MSKKMLINATHPEENRVAIVENGVLTELGIEVAGREPTKGNIYKAAVVRVEPGLQAAFVDYGAERLGFLQIDEVNAAVVKPELKSGARPRINDLLHRGQEILVQIVKEERGTKGAALTTYLSLAGRYMVLMPGTPTRGVSRKAEDDKQRKQMKKALSSLELPENIGCIVRTAALDQTREELERDYLYLMRLYENIETLEKKLKAPALIYKESNLVIRSIRDYFTTDMDEVLIDDPEVYREAREFFEVVMPDQAGLVKLHQERRPIFSRYQIEEQIETISRNKVALPSGGSIVIDTTEALVAIDVNSGKMAGESNVEATATRTNLEAAEEVARQLRLRDLGGLIVIDFIDMRDRKHNRQVEERLKESTARDKARITIGHISQFGMLEMSRQRIKPALTEGAYRTCPHCQGAGRIRSVETLAISVLRRLHAGLAKGQIAEAEAQMAREVASYLLNEKREELVEMERRYQADIQITGRTSFLADQVEITLQKREKEKAAAEYVEAKLHQLPALGTPRPAEVDEEAEADSAAADESATATGKKRRRKRKRKGEGETAEPAAEQAAAASAEPAAAAAEPTEPLAGEVPANETAAKKKRRRRGRKKSGAEETATAGGDSTATAPDEMVAEATAITAGAAPPTVSAASAIGEETAAKKKRRRRGRKKPVAPAGEAAAEQAVAAQPDAGAAAAAGIPPVAEEQPKPARKPRKKPAVASDAAALVDADPQAALAMLPDMPATAETAAPGTKSRTKRGARQQAEATAPAGAEPSVAPIAPATVTKPKRQRAPRLKAPVTSASE
jgi:ribonuclease E